jgi:ABC-type enterobactin transport system permease subunit
VADPSSSPEHDGQLRGELRSVIVLAAAVVGAVLLIAAVGIFVPPVEAAFDQLPIAIIVLVLGTAWILWRVARRSGQR